MPLGVSTGYGVACAMGSRLAFYGTAAIGLWLIRRGGKRTLTGDVVEVRRKPLQPGVFVGGLVLGAGWALSGACPVQVGEGKLLAVFTVAGIVVGTYAFGCLRSARTTANVGRHAHPASS